MDHTGGGTQVEERGGGGGLLAKSCPTLVSVACQAPPSMSMGFSRQEYWSGLPFPSHEVGGGQYNFRLAGSLGNFTQASGATWRKIWEVQPD